MNLLDRNLALEAGRITEFAAIAAARLLGRGDEKSADRAAVKAMRSGLNSLSIDGTVVIGEGERDEAPMLFIGERVGAGGPKVDIALDPLEGTTVTAKGQPNATTVIAMAGPGGFLHAPDIYMEKIAVGPGLPAGIVHLDASPAENVAAVAAAKGMAPEDLVVCLLDRPRHERLIRAVRATGARTSLIGDGDVAAALATARKGSGIDLYMGTGGSPEGVLAAAALRCTGGQFVGRLVYRDEAEKARARALGIEKLDRIYAAEDLASGDVTFACTAVTDAYLLRGVRVTRGKARTHTLIMRSKTGTLRFIETEHNLSRKTWYAEGLDQ